MPKASPRSALSCSCWPVWPDILCGVFGLRAAGDGAKAPPAIVLGVIALIGGVLNIVMAPSVHTVAACVIPVVYFVCALGLKKNAQ